LPEEVKRKPNALEHQRPAVSRGKRSATEDTYEVALAEAGLIAGAVLTLVTMASKPIVGRGIKTARLRSQMSLPDATQVRCLSLSA
jgi:hypothetical protein